MNENDLKTILAALDLSSGATVNDILDRIEILKGETPNTAIENAIRLNYIQSYEKEGLLMMAKNNPGAFGKYINERKNQVIKERKVEFNKLIDDARNDGRLDHRPETKNLLEKAFEMDHEGTKHFISRLNKKLRVMDYLDDTGISSGRSGWTLNDYRKKAPQELSTNPGLYDRLLEEEKGRKEQKNNK